MELGPLGITSTVMISFNKYSKWKYIKPVQSKAYKPKPCEHSEHCDLFTSCKLISELQRLSRSSELRRPLRGQARLLGRNPLPELRGAQALWHYANTTQATRTTRTRQNEIEQEDFIYFIFPSFSVSFYLPFLLESKHMQKKQSKQEQNQVQLQLHGDAFRGFSTQFQTCYTYMKFRFFPHGWAKFCTRHWHEISATAVQPNLASAAMGAS